MTEVSANVKYRIYIYVTKPKYREVLLTKINQVSLFGLIYNLTMRSNYNEKGQCLVVYGNDR